MAGKYHKHAKFTQKLRFRAVSLSFSREKHRFSLFKVAGGRPGIHISQIKSLEGPDRRLWPSIAGCAQNLRQAPRLPAFAPSRLKVGLSDQRGPPDSLECVKSDAHGLLVQRWKQTRLGSPRRAQTLKLQAHEPPRNHQFASHYNPTSIESTSLS